MADSALISNEQLAAQLMQCAILVKKGERSPLLRQTIHDLTDYLTSPPTTTPVVQKSVPAAAAVPVEQRSATTSVTKPTATSAFGVLGKMVGISDTSLSVEPKRSEASKAATSQKNAARIKADLASNGTKQQHHHDKKHHHWFGAGHHDDQEWCEEHFAMGCACKQLKQQQQSQTTNTAAAAAAAAAAASVTSSTSGTQNPINPAKPAFQRPVNTKSALMANGWIEQQRRSKMRFVWKDVLASLVEGRKPGEETTLWIQREVINASGIAKLEALHQIPVKWLQEIKFHEYSTEHRFSLKVYNLTDEFVFRTPHDAEAAQNWVLTLRSAKEVAQKKKATSTGVDEWDTPNRKTTPSFEDEKKVPEQQQQQQREVPQQQYPQLQQQQQQQQRDSVSPPPAAAAEPVPSDGTASHRRPIKELRAIAHGAGISTIGMERGELERVVAQITQQAPNDEEARRQREHQAELERRRQLEEVRKRQAADEARKRQAAEEEARKRQALEEEARKRKAAEEEATRRLQAQARQKQSEEEAARRKAAEEEKRRKDEEEETRRRVAERVKEQTAAERRKREEEERKKLEEERTRRDEEEIQRRIAEHRAAEERRRKEEAYRQQQQQYQQQQQAWKQQQAEEARRRQEAEQRKAEERRRQEEAFRRQQQQQQWQQQQAHPPNQQPRTPNQQQWQQRFPQGPPPPPQKQQQQQQHPGYRPPPNQQQWGTPPPNRPQAGPQPQPQASPINQKYAKMAAQTDDDSQLTIHHIKHGVLVQWALQPPNLQILRPIEVLISTVHTVFPPKFGVPGHEYFSKWTPITQSEVNSSDEKIKKAVKKLRFFLHPDKLPRDLNTEQKFMCKMLWDITSDAFEEHKKKEEDLSWIKT